MKLKTEVYRLDYIFTMVSVQAKKTVLPSPPPGAKQASLFFWGKFGFVTSSGYVEGVGLQNPYGKTMASESGLGAYGVLNERLRSG